MATPFTLDASVFVAAYRTREAAGPISRELLRLARASDLPLIEPAILPVEIAAALAHAGENPAAAVAYAESVMTFPGLALQTLDERMARRTIAVAAECHLRGADALYVAAAAQYGARLVTLDAEQLERAPASVRACKPDAAASLLQTEKNSSCGRKPGPAHSSAD
ncbi:MAG: PIN domain-containing protein [Lentisphaerae bacterium]|nr:PIN domain-containing protein [Lentisphaerota bacterium]